MRLPFVLHNVRTLYPDLWRGPRPRNDDIKTLERFSERFSKINFDYWDDRAIEKVFLHVKNDWRPLSQGALSPSENKRRSVFHLFVSVARILASGLDELSPKTRISPSLYQFCLDNIKKFPPEKMMDFANDDLRIRFSRALETEFPIEQPPEPPEKADLKISGDVRTFIDKIIDEKGSDASELASLPGVEAYEWRHDEERYHYVCTYFVFGTNYDSPWIRFEGQRYWDGEKFGFEQVKDPRPWDIAVYLDGDKPKHVGIVTKNEKLLPKWGYGPILEHPILTAPAFYGTPQFFRMRGV